MEFIPTTLSDVILIRPKVVRDDRGFFLETWERRKFAASGIDEDFVQDNHSRSVKGTLRGLHYQVRQPQGKLVRVTSGRVFDVVVDIRKNSPTFGRWIGEFLSMDNMCMLWVPPGFAHGFYVVSEFADFQYKCTEFYMPEYERCIRWDDETLRIDWPLTKGAGPLVSDKDKNGQCFDDADIFG